MLAIVASGTLSRPVAAQASPSVQLTGPAENPLRTVTPRFTLRATGFGAARPLRFTLQIATTATFSGAPLVDTTIVSQDSVVNVLVRRILPSDETIYWRASATSDGGPSATSPVTGPRRTLPWVTLIAPTGTLDVRRPLFVWQSPSIAPEVGQWRFDFELSLTSNGRQELAASLLGDTTFLPQLALQANTSYRWSIRATAPTGASMQRTSDASFVIIDPALPTTTLLYQNFPNPFPSARAFATCFWFDVGAQGARISLEVLDLRGNLVRTIIPGDDGQSDFLPGRYGRGIPGLGNNCDNRFVWNGTANDGRTVARGAYLLRFTADGGKPTFRTIIFQGR